MKRSKKYLEVAKLVEKNKTYPLEEAIALAKKTSNTKFKSSVEVHARLGIDPRKGDQQVRSTVILPHGTGKTKKIAVFTNDEQLGKESGADLVGGKELIDEIKKSGKIEFDIAIATPEIMRDLALIARILGPRGLMPSPKNETVTKNVKKAVTELKGGKLPFKNDSTANVHVIIGNTDFTDEQLLENFKAFYQALRKAKPSNSKGVYFKNISLSTTMGPGIKIAGITTMT